MKPTKTLFILCFCTIILALLLTACGSSDTQQVLTDSTTPAAIPNPTTTPVAPTVTPSPATTSSSLATVTPLATSSASVTTDAPTNPATTTSPATIAPKTTVVSKTAAPATTEAAPVTTSTPGTTEATPSAGDYVANLVYTKEDGLFAYNIATAKSFELADGQILRYKVSPDNRRVAFLKISGDHLELNLVVLHGNSASDPGTLDSNVGIYVPSTQDNPYAGRFMRAYTLDFSPDSNLVVYSKMNSNGPLFECWGTQVHPVELWLAELQNYSVKRLAPNAEKDFMYNPTFSPDQARVGFLRSKTFPSDVSSTTQVWSVHTDGTKLTILQDGVSLTKQAFPGAPADEAVAGLINSFSWTGPQAVTFFVSGTQGGSAWVHDLSTAHVRQLFNLTYGSGDPETGPDYRYDALSQRYAFNNDKGLFTIGTASAQDKAVAVTGKPVHLLNFYDNTLFYLNDSNTVLAQRINSKGASSGAALALPAIPKPNGTVYDALVANGTYLVIWATEAGPQNLKLTLIGSDGKSVLGQPLQHFDFDELVRLTPGYFLLNSTDHRQLLDLSSSSKWQLVNL
ncbi:MAG TPA: hypothetical protein VH186_23930 [Chloroflexia bacterium]|nr:hypothetical protein [Chloroflexia bacterium]